MSAAQAAGFARTQAERQPLTDEEKLEARREKLNIIREVYGSSPELRQLGPNPGNHGLINGRYGIYATLFAYDLRPREPWFPEDILQKLVEAYEALPRLVGVDQQNISYQIRVTFDRYAIHGQRDFPNYANAPPALRAALPAIDHALTPGVWPYMATKLTARGEPLPIARVKEFLDRADNNYDMKFDVEEIYGNMMSRVIFDIRTFTMPAGRGLDEVKKELEVPEKALIDIRAADPFCGQACLAYAIASTADKANIRGVSNTARATSKAIDVANMLSIYNAMTIEDFKVFVEKMFEQGEVWRVVVLRTKTEVLYDTGINLATPDRTVHLLLHDNHYYYITNINLFCRRTPRSTETWCDGCNAAYTPAKMRTHACLTACGGCGEVFTSLAHRQEHMTLLDPGSKPCTRCNFDFLKNPNMFYGCAARHTCSTWHCLECKGKYPLARGLGGHVCTEAYCAKCKVYFMPEEPHQCYIMPKKLKELPAIEYVDHLNYWAYDLECCRGEGGAQVITTAVFKKLYTPTIRICNGEEELFNFIRDNGKAVYIAHNGAKYDTFLIYHVLLKRSSARQSAVFQGQKILKLQWSGATFLDSLRHLSVSLEKCARDYGLLKRRSYFPHRLFAASPNYSGPVPAAELFGPEDPARRSLWLKDNKGFAAWHASKTGRYDIRSEWRSYWAQDRKGFFPYEFYTLENVAYVGPVPGAEYFTASAQEDPDFAVWHRLKQEGPYDIAEEVKSYCVQDVDLLAAVLEKYRGAAIRNSGIDPLTKTTIASYAMAVYRTNFMKPNTFAILAPNAEAYARQFLTGGRTDARMLLRQWTPEEVARGCYGVYKDVNSLYPWVLRECPLPVGAPRMASAAAVASPHAYLASLGATAALVHCDVICPRDLYHPVLVATERDGRLRATLEDKVGAHFTSIELLKAVSLGYTVTKIHDSMEFETSSSEFKGYIDFYYRLKNDARARGADADYALAKMNLNTLWGKFAQKPSDGTVAAYKDVQAWYSALAQAMTGRTLLDVKGSTAEYVLASVTPAYQRPLDSTNVALASFITAHARLKLYSALEVLGRRVIYHDTDSVIYESCEVDPLDNGDELGQWKDECGGAPITDVCCLGPKTYAYRYTTADGAVREVIKCKGFSAMFTFDDYLEVASKYFTETLGTLTSHELVFKRCLGEGISVVASVPKTMTPLMDKVEVITPTLTLPRGHKDIPASYVRVGAH